MTPSKALFYFCISFVVGIALNSIITIPQSIFWGFLIFGVFIIFTAFLKRNTSKAFGDSKYIVIGFCVIFLALGILRFQVAEFTIISDPLRKLNDRPEKIALIGQITDEPDIRDNAQKLKIKIKNTKSIILITAALYPQYRYLDTIKVTGLLKTPPEFADFNYKNYLLKDGIYSVMDYPKTELILHNHTYNTATFLYEKILFFKEKLRQSMYVNFSGSESNLLEGIILGNNKNMPQDFKNQLNATGLRYLTAISGVHVIIISAMLMALLLMLGLWRGQAFYFSIVFIWLYIALTGFSASGIRAATMGSIFLLAQKLGRQNTGSRTITLAAAIMLFLNPLLLLYDIGFQLSFLAALGIIYFKPLLENIIKMVTKEHLKYVVEILAVTLTAQIFVVPVMIYNFGNMSLIAPLTNLLVVPIFYPLMMFGFLASILGIFSHILGWIFSVPCWFLLAYFVKVLQIFSQPWALATIKNVSWLWLVLYYIMLVVIIWFLQRKQKPKFLGY